MPELPPAMLDDVQVVEQSQLDAQNQVRELAESLQDSDSRRFADDAITSMGKSAALLGETLQSTQRATLQQALAAAQASYQNLLKLRAREFEVSRSQNSPSSSGSASQAERQQKLDQLELEN